MKKKIKTAFNPKMSPEKRKAILKEIAKLQKRYNKLQERYNKIK